jgi:hypothetical protein
MRTNDRKCSLQHGDEVGTLVGELRVLLAGSLGLVGRPLARVLDAQERDQRQAFLEAAGAAGLDQDARETRVHRQCRHLAAEPGDAAIAVDGAEFLQQPVAVVEQPRVGWIEERKVVGAAERERRHLQDEAREVGAQDLRFGIARPCEVIVLGIEADADTLALAPAPPATLVGARARLTGSIGSRWNFARGL